MGWGKVGLQRANPIWHPGKTGPVAQKSSLEKKRWIGMWVVTETSKFTESIYGGFRRGRASQARSGLHEMEPRRDGSTWTAFSFPWGVNIGWQAPTEKSLLAELHSGAVSDEGILERSWQVAPPPLGALKVTASPPPRQATLLWEWGF